MRRVFFMCFDAAVAAAILLPIFAALDHVYFHSRRRSCLYFLFAVYLSAMFAVVGLPDVCYVRFDPNLNFTPFAYMFSDYLNSLLNVLLFVPLGFFLPLLWSRFRGPGRTLLFGFSTSLLIEVLQIFTLRATDVNDLMTNTAGTFLGWCAGRLLLWAAPGIQPSRKTREALVVCAAAFGVMFFLQPFLADFLFLRLF